MILEGRVPQQDGAHSPNQCGWTKHGSASRGVDGDVAGAGRAASAEEVAAVLVVIASLGWLARLFWLKCRCAVCRQLGFSHIWECIRLRITCAC